MGYGVAPMFAYSPNCQMKGRGKKTGTTTGQFSKGTRMPREDQRRSDTLNLSSKFSLFCGLLVVDWLTLIWNAE
jgi:hypothetical protein